MNSNLKHNSGIIKALYMKLAAASNELDRPKKAITAIGCDLLRTEAIENYYRSFTEYKNCIKFSILGVY